MTEYFNNGMTRTHKCRGCRDEEGGGVYDPSSLPKCSTCPVVSEFGFVDGVVQCPLCVHGVGVSAVSR